MKIASLIHRDVATCSTHDHLDRAAQLMWDRDIGCLPVVDDQGHVSGIITDRDICMAAYTKGMPLVAIPVVSVMSHHVFSCSPADDVHEVERTMSQQQIRRMPVIDDHGHPIGIVSVNDLARAAAGGKVPSVEIAATLAAVTAPRPLTKTAAS